MAQTKITLLGLYGYFDSLGGDLFTYLNLPEGMDKETFTDTLFLDYGERAVLYPNPELFQRMIGAWSSKWSVELTRIAKTLLDNYEPLYNIDRFEAVTDKTTDKAKETNSGSLSEAGTGSGTLSETLTGSGSLSETLIGSGSVTANNGNTSSMTTENQTSAYNSSTYEPKDKTVQSGSGTETISQTTGSNDSRNQTTGSNDSRSQTTGNQTSLNQITGSEKNNDYSRDFSHTAHFYGNGGVTMSQQMVESEIKLREKYNLYHEACKLFSDDLLLYIY